MGSLSSYNNNKHTLPLMLLKDYLRDDMSSCSSNGFKSFPRRQCCVTVRVLIKSDLRYSSNNFSSKKPRGIAGRSHSRVVEAVINAVKLLPFRSSSARSPSTLSKSRRGSLLLLPSSLTRKWFKKGFWRKPEREKEKDIPWWRLFHLEENKSLDARSVENPTKVLVAVNRGRISTSSSSNNNENGNKWSQSEFTAATGKSSNWESSGHDAAESNKDGYYLPRTKKVSGGDGLGITVGGEEDSVTYSVVGRTKEWPNEDKVQFSPVSVLDCPFEDEEEISSPITCSLLHFEGRKEKLMGKIGKLENLAKLEPLNLEKRFALAESDCGMIESFDATQPCSISTHLNDGNKFEAIEEKNVTEKKAKELLRLAKATTPVAKLESLLLDFFREQIERSNASASMSEGDKQFEQELQLARDWIQGKPKGVILGWEVKEGRHFYVRDMEKNGVWKTLDEEKAEVALELEVEAFNSLLEEALLDFL